MAVKNFWKCENGAASMWGITIVAALVIIAVSVYVAMNRSAPVQETVTEKTPPKPQPVPEPKTEPVITQRKEVEPPPAERQPVAREEKPEAQPKYTGPPQLQLDNLAGTLELTVPFLAKREKIPLRHTCYRRNQSPSMSWQDSPSETKSYVIFLERRTTDEDEPFVNWIVFNIPANVTELGEGQGRDPELPDGAEHATSDHNNTGYIGPCEPKGRHKYALRIFALDTVLDIKAGVHKHDLIRAMNGHIIDAAEQPFIHFYR